MRAYKSLNLIGIDEYIYKKNFNTIMMVYNPF